MRKFWIFLTILICSLMSWIVFAENERIWLTFSIPNIVRYIKILDYNKLPDNNFQKFVWVGQPFFDVKYEPSDLVYLQWLYHISAQNKHQLREEAALHLEKLAIDFYKEFWTNIVVASAYRSYRYQKDSISESCKKSWRCAREWESEHQLWLAVDLREATNEEKFLSKYQKYYDWLHENAHKYWFTQSFQNWREIDGYYIEPRHWRYLWVDLATKLHEKGITFTQYVKGTTK